MTPECVEQIETLIEKFQNGEAGQFSAKYDELQQVRLDYSVEHSNIGIFLWCPMTRFGIAIRCPVHGMPLSRSRWVYKDSDTPRIIYGLTMNSLLVQRYYYCGGGERKSKHKILSTDPDIMRQLTANQMSTANFKLRHKCGWTLDLTNFIFTQISHGCTFLDIAEQVERLRLESWGNKFDALSLKELGSYSYENVSHSFRKEFEQSDYLKVPSRDIIETIFLETFGERKQFYEHFMDDLTATSISMDHTFKVSKNIGVVRCVDQKWTQQYSGLFIVLNEQGLVLTWSFTATEKFGEISHLLSSLRDRMSNKGRIVRQAYLDNCCKWSKCLEEVFGPGLDVKLDIFHGLQRITRTIPKRHKKSSACSADLKFVVRDRDDQGAIRTRNTPNQSVIEENMSIFVSKWSNNGNDSSPWTADTDKEVSNLLVSQDEIIIYYYYLQCFSVCKRVIDNPLEAIPL